MPSLNEKRTLRTTIMRWLYEATQGDEREIVNGQGFSSIDSVDVGEIAAAIKYLEGEYLLEAHWTMGPSLPHLQILHGGVVEMERALRTRDEETSHFVPLNSISITNVYGDLNTSQYQQGTSNSSQVLVIQGNEIEQCRILVSAIRENLTELGVSEEVVVELSSDLDSIEEELLKPSPRTSILKAFFGGVRLVIQGAVTETISQKLLGMHWPF